MPRNSRRAWKLASQPSSAVVAKEQHISFGEEGAWYAVAPPRNVFALKKQFSGARAVEVLVDSGAAESVMPDGMLPHVVKPNASSLAGESYYTACGKKVPCKGEQIVDFTTREGHDCKLTFQVTDVTKPLLSVAQLVASGHKVEFEKAGGTNANKATGKTKRFVRRAGLYVLHMWVRPPNGDTLQEFARQGK